MLPDSTLNSDRASDTADAPGPTGTFLVVLPWEPVSSSGVNQVVLNLLDQIAIHGEFRPLLLIQSWKYAVPETAKVGEHTCIRFRVRSTDSAAGTLRGFLAYWLLLPFELRKLLRLLHEHSVTAINIHYPGLSATSFALLKFLGLYRGRLIMTFHGLDLKLAHETRGWRQALWNWNGLQADAITGCSTALAHDLVAAFPRWKSRIHAIHNGLDVDRFVASGTRASSEDPELRGKRYVLNVGTFEVKKAQEILIRAFHLIAGRFPDVLLVLVGGAGPTRAGLESMVAECGIADKVVFRENIDHSRMAAYYRDATVFALPSRSEPFGIAILEAGAFGVPVVASRTGGIPEIITSRRYGILVEPEDAPQLADALAELLADPVLAKATGLSLKERVVEVFSWVAAYRKYRACAVEE